LACAVQYEPIDTSGSARPISAGTAW
jgi:hypothetical protein